MPNIRISGHLSDRVGIVVQEVAGVLHRLAQSPSDEELVLDLKGCKWFPPLLVAPLAAIKYHQQKAGRQVRLILPSSHYLAAIRFPDGLAPHVCDNWKEELDYYTNRSYLPLTYYPTGLSNDSVVHREQFFSAIGKLMRGQLKIRTNIFTALQYLIDETALNVVDHSQTECGWVIAQHYPKKGYVDLCIVSYGRTLLDSYNDAHLAGNEAVSKAQITDHLSAARYAVNGLSTKYNNISRGYGISTSRNMLVEGLSGQYTMWSGNALFNHGSKGSQADPAPQIIALGETAHWPGVLTMLRMPVVERLNFQYSDYAE